MKTLILSLLTVFCTLPCLAQKVANFSTGAFGKDDWELFQFWSNGKIEYTFGADEKAAKITYGGKTTYKGAKALTLKFINGLKLFVVAGKDHLYITDGTPKYDKRFNWHYEGPIDGIGTFCDVCAEDEKEAVAIVRKKFL